MRAGEAGISARHVAYFPDKGIEVIGVSRRIPGTHAPDGDMKRPRHSRLRCCAFSPPFTASNPCRRRRRCSTWSTKHRVQAAQLKVTMPANFAQVMREYDAAKSAFLGVRSGHRPGTHIEPDAGQLPHRRRKPMMLVGFRVRLQQRTGPTQLGLTLCEFSATKQRIHESVEDVYGRAGVGDTRRVQACIAIADIKWGPVGLRQSATKRHLGLRLPQIRNVGSSRGPRRRSRTRDGRNGFSTLTCSEGETALGQVNHSGTGTHSI